MSINYSEAEILTIKEQINGLIANKATLDKGLTLAQAVSRTSSFPDVLRLDATLELILRESKKNKDLIIDTLREVAARSVDNRSIQFRLGHHFESMDLIDDAIDVYRCSIRLKPTAKAMMRLGNILKNRDEYSEAHDMLHQAALLNQDYVQYLHLFYRYCAIRSLDDEINGRMEFSPLSDTQKSDVYNKLGQMITVRGFFREGRHYYEKAVELNPNSLRNHWPLHLSVPLSYQSQQTLDDARQQYLDGLAIIGDKIDDFIERDVTNAYEVTLLPTNFEIHYQSEDDMTVQVPYGQLMHKVSAAKYPEFAQSLALPKDLKGRRIRIGFASYGCFMLHSNYKSHGAFINQIDTSKFEVFAYQLALNEDRFTEKMRNEVEHYRPYDNRNHVTRQQIYDDKLDMLIYPGISMEPIVHTLAPHRLAPVQCTSWGHPITSGLPNIDYYLSSELMEPENGDDLYTEQLVRLPNLGISQIITEMPREFTEPDILKGRKRANAVLLCSQNLLKLQPHNDIMFVDLLKRISDAEIWFIAAKKNDINDQFTTRLSQLLKQHGLDFARHCLVLPRLNKRSFCWVNKHVDIMIDTPFWSGCNTTFETLIHGTPVVTLPGNTMRGRHTYAILRHLGLTELIAKNESEYTEIIHRLASDDAFMAQTRQRITAVKDRLAGDPKVISAFEAFVQDAVRGQYKP